MSKFMEKQEAIVTFVCWMNEWGSRNRINYMYIFITYKVSSNKLCMHPLHPKKSPLKNGVHYPGSLKHIKSGAIFQSKAFRV